MFTYTIKQIADISNSVLYSKTPDAIVTNIHFDSRSFVQIPHALFLAIPGKNHNGHKYIADLYAQGCTLFWVEKGCEYPLFDDAHYVESENVLRAFQTLCAYHRNQFSIPVIAITGSNGKTIVKEWLHHILSAEYAVVRSPRSYNSQIGVPLSLSLMSESHQIAIVEAGISMSHEMEHLQKMIQPTIGIFTNIGDAHSQNFESIEQKIAEKMKLFAEVKSLIYCADYRLIHASAQNISCEKYAWSTTGNGNIHVQMQNRDAKTTQITIVQNAKKDVCTVPFVDSASLENCVHCIIAATILSAQQTLDEHIQTLPQIEMRLEQKKGIHNCTIINDSYNSDLQSIRIVLEFLSQQKQHSKKTLILSDVQQTGMANDELYKEISELIAAHEISRFIGIGSEISKYAHYIETEHLLFENTHDFLQAIATIPFENELIVLKGARCFAFEQIAQRLELQIHHTVLEINLNALIDNLNYFRSFLYDETKIMIMVKAFSYGSGTFEIANILQNQKVDYLAVAFVDEGIELRKAGITIPIVVMNPEISTVELAYIHNLEIEVYNFAVLHEVFRCAALHPEKQYNIHIKIDTGMVRYGFQEHELPKLMQEIKAVPQCVIASVFSHLVGSDEARFDAFTHEQIALFEICSSYIQSLCAYPIIRHILNSAGIERFPEHQYTMVRLGIGLYGISAVNQEKTRHVSTLKTHISHIRSITSGTSVGYSRAGTTTRDSRIAVLPIGYADGLRRTLSNGVGTVLLHNVEVPIIGNICMDATMIDITGVDAEIGDEVILFGEKHPITTMAQKLATIPYEVITSVSQRVKRIYYLE